MTAVRRDNSFSDGVDSPIVTCVMFLCAPAGQSYWESNILGTVQYPDGVKLIVAEFFAYFGTAYGETLREWCLRYKWGLAWTVSAYNSTAKHSYCSDPRRLLDPVTLVRDSALIAWCAAVRVVPR